MSTMWREVAETCWRAGDIDAATFAHGQAVQSEACSYIREREQACKTIALCPKCECELKVEHCPVPGYPAWAAWCWTECDDLLNGGVRGATPEDACRKLTEKWEAANE